VQDLVVNISVVVPVYKSERTLPDLVAALKPVLDEVAHEYELILVNDGSPDNSKRIMRQLAITHAWIRAINFKRNFGQHSALLCGMRAARYEITVTLDDDLQNPPDQLPKLLAKLEEGYDVVYGVPPVQQHGLARNLAGDITKLVLQSAMGADCASKIRSFRVFRTNLRDAFADYRSPSVMIDVLLSWGTKNFAWVPIRHDERQHGASNYTLAKLVTHALNMITGFTTMPLRIATINGFLFILFGLGVLAFVIVRYLIAGECVQGFPFLASIIAIFAGAQLFSLGIMGEYMARMYTKSIDRPQYVVCEEEEESRVPAKMR